MADLHHILCRVLVELYMRRTQMDGPEVGRVSEKVELADVREKLVRLDARGVLEVKFREPQVPETNFTKDSVRLGWVDGVLPL